MNYRLTAVLSKHAIKTRIEHGIDRLCEIPPEGDIRKLGGRDKTFRLRIGSFRIIFTADYREKTLYIRDIDNRGDIY